MYYKVLVSFLFVCFIVSSASAVPAPTYSVTFDDAVTGDNEFLYDDGGTDRHA